MRRLVGESNRSCSWFVVQMRDGQHITMRRESARNAGFKFVSDHRNYTVAVEHARKLNLRVCVQELNAL